MKLLATSLMLLLCLSASAQNISDVLRYGTENMQGTARYQAMGGAFGAVGGDLSAIQVNPAASAVFNHGVFGITGTRFGNENNATYFGSSTLNEYRNTDLNQVGAAFVFRNTSGSEWKKIALAVNYDLVDNYDNEIYVRGNSQQGLDTYFLSAAQGVPFGDLLIRDGELIEEAYLDIGASLGFLDQQAFLGYYGGLIDPQDADDNNNTSYISNASYNTVSQELYKSTAGYNSKFALNLATQYQDDLYLGANLNFHSVLYDEVRLFDENGYAQDSEIQFSTFDNRLRTEGSGFSFSLGAIARLSDQVRIGGSYQSPTWYRLMDETSQRINSDLADSDIGFIDFNVVNLFQEYTVKTPGKVTGSLALVFGKEGLLSFDYGYQDFSEAQLQPVGDPVFADENNFISNTLGGVNSIRLGGEYRIDQLSLRGGYRYESSPYEGGGPVGDLNVYSGGLGYTFGPNRLDLAYSRGERTNELAVIESFNTGAQLDAVFTNISLGYTLSF